MRHFSFLLLVSLSTLSWTPRPFHPALSHAPLVSVAEIQNWLKDPVRPVTSVETLLERLPPVYRQHFTMQFKSRSLHTATERQPRIIFYGPDARLLMGISTNPEDPRFHVVEMIEYNPVQHQFEFHTIDFLGTAAPQVTPQHDECTTCHRSDLRPNWDAYDLWPGAFGSHHDSIFPNTPQNAWFEDLITRKKNDGRLQYLSDSFYMAHQSILGGRQFSTVGGGIGANAGLTLLVNFLNRERIADRLQKSPDHTHYKFAILSALFECPEPIESLVPGQLQANHPRSYAAILEETRTLLQQERTARLTLAERFLKVFNREYTEEYMDRFYFREAEVTRVAKLRYLLENRRSNAVAMEAWSLPLSYRSYNFHDGSHGLEGLAGHYAPLAFDAEFLNTMPLTETPYAVSSYMASSGGHHHDHGGIADPYALTQFEVERGAKHTSFCRNLERSSNPMALSAPVN